MYLNKRYFFNYYLTKRRKGSGIEVVLNLLSHPGNEPQHKELHSEILYVGTPGLELKKA